MAAPAVLIVATSARVLAAAACRHYRPYTVDIFADSDTARFAAHAVRVAPAGDYGLARQPLLAALERLTRRVRTPLGVVYGSGFEGAPELLDAVARRVRILGCAPAVHAALADMPALVARIERDSLSFPPTARRQPASAHGWLAKQDGACGGLHVRMAEPAGATDAATYFQQYMPGTVHSALFLANSRICVLCGVARHLRVAPAPVSSFAWQGAISLDEPPLPPAVIERCGAALARALGLRGGFGVDFIAADGRVVVLDINARLPASLDVYADRATILRAHITACAHDTLLYSRPAARPARATVVLYARAAAIVPRRFEWPCGVADVPPEGSVVAAGEPLVSVIAEASCGDAALALLTGRCRELARRLAAHGVDVLAPDMKIVTVGGCDV